MRVFHYFTSVKLTFLGKVSIISIDFLGLVCYNGFKLEKNLTQKAKNKRKIKMETNRDDTPMNINLEQVDSGDNIAETSVEQGDIVGKSMEFMDSDAEEDLNREQAKKQTVSMLGFLGKLATSMNNTLKDLNGEDRVEYRNGKEIRIS